MQLHIKKTGMYVEINDESGMHMEEISTLGIPISYYLPYIVILDADLVLADVLNVLSQYKDHLLWIFLGHIKNFELLDVLHPVQQGDDKLSGDINSIGFIWESEITYRPDERLPEIDSWPSCVGVRSKKNDAYIEINFIDFGIPDLFYLLDKPVYLDTYLEYGETDPSGKYHPAMTGYREWTLHDLVTSVLMLGLPIVESDEEDEDEETDDNVLDRPEKPVIEISDIITATHLVEILDDMEKPKV